jgi:hypothetical protein
MSNPWSDGRYALSGLGALVAMLAGGLIAAELSMDFWFSVGIVAAILLVIWGVEGDGLGYLLGLMLLLAMLVYSLVKA